MLLSGAKVSLSISIIIDQLVQPPLGSYIKVHLRDAGINPIQFPIDAPGSVLNWGIPLPLALPGQYNPVSLNMGIEVSAGKSHRIKLDATVPSGHVILSFNVNRGKQQYGKISIDGGIMHSPSIRPICEVRCLPFGSPKGPGECVECENDDAIVRLCC